MNVTYLEDQMLVIRRRGADGAPGLVIDHWPPLAVEGVTLFDAGTWWEAHEKLEDVMLEVPGGDGPLLYRAIIQADSALHQLSR